MFNRTLAGPEYDQIIRGSLTSFCVIRLLGLSAADAEQSGCCLAGIPVKYSAETTHGHAPQMCNNGTKCARAGVPQPELQTEILFGQFLLHTTLATG